MSFLEYTLRSCANFITLSEVVCAGEQPASFHAMEREFQRGSNAGTTRVAEPTSNHPVHYALVRTGRRCRDCQTMPRFRSVRDFPCLSAARLRTGPFHHTRSSHFEEEPSHAIAAFTRRRRMHVSFLSSRSRSRKSFLTILALIAATGLLMLFPTLASAQFRGSIQGVVTDTQGGVIPGAKVTLTNTQTNETQTRATNGEGIYNFNALGPGHYTIVAEAKGFQTKTLNNVQIIPEQANAINIQLAIVRAATTLSVDASKMPLLDTETPTIGGTISSNEIEHMPSFGRDVFQLSSLAPGTTGDRAQAAGGGTNSLPGTQGPGGPGATGGIFATENGPQTLAAGGQYESNGISIDGISTVSAVWGGTSIITPTEDSVESVKVVSTGYNAENSRFSGAQMEVTSKTGTNTIHGSAYFQAWRPGLNAYQRYNGNPFAFYNLDCGGTPCTPEERGLTRDNGRFNQMGGSIGGPLWKNHVFAFFAYETQRNNSPNIGSGWYETSAFRGMAPT